MSQRRADELGQRDLDRRTCLLRLAKAVKPPVDMTLLLSMRPGGKGGVEHGRSRAIVIAGG